MKEPTGFKSPQILGAILVTVGVGVWGIVDNAALSAVAAELRGTLFTSRGWFIMTTVSGLLFTALWLAFSNYGRIRLGPDDSRPEFSTVSWLTMLFAAGMGIGLLFWASAEPLSHFILAREFESDPRAAEIALFLTLFHWGIHAWAIYAMIALVIAYFMFRKGLPGLLSAPFAFAFPGERWALILGRVADFMALVAIAIGLAGSIAMGVFQVRSGIVAVFGGGDSSTLVWIIFVLLVIAYVPPLLVDLGSGMAKLSNAAMGITAGLVVFIVLAGPTQFIMGVITDAFGTYLIEVWQAGFRTYSFAGDDVGGWFHSWTLTYMVWWLAWAPFVGVFIARISRGRTIREFLLCVMLVPTIISLFWFGSFGGIAFFEALRGEGALLELVAVDVEQVTFAVLDGLPLSMLTSVATMVAAFLFIVTSVVSAAFVLGMFSRGGDPNPDTGTKLVWGVILGLLGVVMILSGDIEAIRAIIALGAMPFVFLVSLLVVCLVRALRAEKLDALR